VNTALEATSNNNTVHKTTYITVSRGQQGP